MIEKVCKLTTVPCSTLFRNFAEAAAGRRIPTGGRMRHLISCGVLLFVCFVVTKQQNSTNPRRGQHRDSNLMSAVQLMQVQLTTLETEAQRHSSRIQEVVRATTRLETQRQELMATMDRSEGRLMQRIDDVKGEARKIITLQDVMREDIDKIQQNQLLNKVWLEEQIRQMSSYVAVQRQDPLPDHAANLQSSTDILANLQILQSTLYSLRRMADTLQSSIATMKTNLTDLTNVTRSMMRYEQESLVTKAYFQSALQMFMDEKSELPLIHWFNPTANQEHEEKLPRDCFEVQQQIQNKSGIYRIRFDYASKPIFAYCDMDTEEGGWTVFQRRIDGSTDFLREWQDYKHGFGNVGGEFWLGNENLYLLTHQDLYELRIDLSDFEGNTAYAKYGGFAVGSEKEKYMLKLLGPLTGGDAGDGMTYHAAMPFSTIDADYDRWPNGHCAVDHAGGWWYNQCDASNLNGKYLRGLNPYEYQGVYWHEWQGPSYSLQSTKMMLRPTRKKYLAVRNVTEVRIEDEVEQPVDPLDEKYPAHLDEEDIWK